MLQVFLVPAIKAYRLAQAATTPSLAFDMQSSWASLPLDKRVAPFRERVASIFPQHDLSLDGDVLHLTVATENLLESLPHLDRLLLKAQLSITELHFQQGEPFPELSLSLIPFLE